jgi:ABC-type nitrate/sulfonate/bicarbonate transport system substrate-binding protein
MRSEWWVRRAGASLAAVAVVLAACAAPAAPAAVPRAAGPAAEATAAAPAGPGASASAAAAPAVPPAPTTLLYGLQGGDIAYYWQLYVAQEQGLLADEAIDLDVIATRTTPDTTQAIVTGALHLSATTPSSAILARAQDPTAPLAIVAGAMEKITSTVVGAPSVRTLADVRGKTVGTGALRTTSTYLMRQLFRERGGLVEERDYDFVQIGSTGDRLAALMSGGIAASDMSQPRDFQLVDQGYHLLGSLSDLVADYTFLAVVTNSAWASENADALMRFVRAWSRASVWLAAPANRTRAVEILARRTNIDAPLAARIYESYVEQKRVFTPDGSVSLPALKGVIDLMVEVGDLSAPAPDPSRFVDTRYYEAARSRG